MTALRTPKEATGIDLGIPSLTARAWYEARYGYKAWERLESFEPKVWRDYLDWYRDVLNIPVESGVEVTSIEPADNLLVAHLRQRNRTERVHARKIVLATGIEGNGAWKAPKAFITDLPTQRYAHSTDDIDFDRLTGKCVGVLGVGASAFDNAAAALEAGAKRVDLCFRRLDVPRVNPLEWTHFAGMLGHFGELSDLERWRFMRHILQELPQPPPQDAFWRCRKFENFAWHPNCAWDSVRQEGDAAIVETKSGTFEFDFIIFATGTETDLSVRPELTPIVDQIALWRDRFTPPCGEESEELGRYPYLGTAFEFMEREPGGAPFLGRLHNFTYGAMASHGLTGAAIIGLKYGVPRLIRGLVRDLFWEDRAQHFQDLLGFAAPELETLDSEFEWIKDRRKRLFEEATTVVKRGLVALAVEDKRSSKKTHKSAKRRRERRVEQQY
jgi:cation diffusion facilitator CzcD-associated flavoprotein CzcO